MFNILDKTPKEILIYVQLERPEIAKIKFENKTNLSIKLQQLEEKFKVNRYKFGVLNVKKDQKTENEVYSNVEMSAEMEEFLEFLGTRIRLLNWTGYTGGLNTKYDSTGSHSVFTKFSEIDIMFHVCPLLPYSEKDLQQVERKRHIGNDAVVIIFLDSDAQNFDPRVLVSEFNHVYMLVSPVKINGGTFYKIEIAYKAGVKPFNPPLTLPSIYKKNDEFRNFFLTKMINAERSAMESPAFATKLARTKSQMLEEFIQ